MEVLSRYALDLKLGLRMLRRFWGLTVVGGFAMTIVIALAAGSVSFLRTSKSSVPLEEGDRLVGLTLWDAEDQRRRRPSLAQFQRWRETLTSVQDLAAFASVERRFTAGPGIAEQPVEVAEMTASGFRAARVPPRLGRVFVDSDELPGAPAVVVIGYDVWRSRYGSDPDVIGDSLNLSGVEHDIIGVMPEGFAFPVNHDYWTPLQRVSTDEQTEVFVLGRLAPGYRIENARAEVETIGPLSPAGDERIEQAPQVQAYTLALTGGGNPLGDRLISYAEFLVTLLLLPPCLNIAILVYARTLTRQEELATRYALGANRGRLVAQLFLEILLLAALSACFALLLVHAFFGLDLFRSDRDPFWVDYTTVSIATVPFAAAFAVVAALIAGTIPAWQITRRLQQHGFGSSSHRATMRLGATWTVLVVAQVALAVAALPAAIELGWGKLRPGLVGPGFAADRFLTFELRVDAESQGAGSRDEASSGAALAEAQRKLVQRLEDEPDILAVTASSALPGAEFGGRIEIDVAGGQVSPSFEFAQINRVDANFLGVFGIDVIAGRGFEAGDLGLDSPPIVVNRTFAESIGVDVVGRQLRIAVPGLESGGWSQVVGVVADHPSNSDRPRVYAAQTGVSMPLISVRVPGDASTVAMRLPSIVSGLDSSLYVANLRSLSEVYGQIDFWNSMQFLAVTGVMLSVILLSVAGVYAMLSFTVNQRRQEIGIRSALGAQPGRIIFGVFRRAAWQIGLGALIGLSASVLLDTLVPMEPFGGRDVVAILPIVAVTMIAVGCLAAVAPARRALAVAPTDALREA